MRKIMFTFSFLLIVFHNIQAESQLKITLLNGTENTIYVTDSVDEIYGVKSQLYFNKAGQCIQKYEHKSPIINIDGISELGNLKKVSLYMELNSFNDFSVFESKSIESVCISYGLSENCLHSIERMPLLKTVYLDSMTINTMDNINLNNTQINYLEISYSKLTKVSKCIFPQTLKYLNIRGNGYVAFDNTTIDEINNKQITVVTDYKIDGIINQIIGEEYYRLLPETFRNFGP